MATDEAVATKPGKASAPKEALTLNNLSWDSKPQSFPAGTVPGGWLVQINGQPDRHVQDRGSIPCSLPPGDYTAKVTRLDIEGKPLGEPVEQKFTAGGHPVSIDVPSSVHVVPA